MNECEAWFRRPRMTDEELDRLEREHPLITTRLTDDDIEAIAQALVERTLGPLTTRARADHTVTLPVWGDDPVRRWRWLQPSDL